MGDESGKRDNVTDRAEEKVGNDHHRAIGGRGGIIGK